MRFLSICSGIEAASCALEPLGFSAVAYAEIDCDAGHDSFLLDDAHYHDLLRAYLENISL